MKNILLVYSGNPKYDERAEAARARTRISKLEDRDDASEVIVFDSIDYLREFRDALIMGEIDSLRVRYGPGLTYVFDRSGNQLMLWLEPGWSGK